MSKIIKKPKSAKTRIAICAMIRGAQNFDTWLDYHFLIGINHVFLRVEETPELKKIVSHYKGRVTARFVSGVGKDDYFGRMMRQKKFIRQVLALCRKKKINWLFHIDADELICPLNSRNISEIILSVPKKFSNAIFRNYEAVYPKADLNNPFLETDRFYDCAHMRFYKSYTNGKSAGKVRFVEGPWGCHRFKGISFNVPEETAIILHYDSPSYKTWLKKFSALSGIGRKKLKEISCQFNKESILVISKPRWLKNGMALEWYKKHKVLPYYKNKSLVKVTNIFLQKLKSQMKIAENNPNSEIPEKKISLWK